MQGKKFSVWFVLFLLLILLPVTHAMSGSSWTSTCSSSTSGLGPELSIDGDAVTFWSSGVHGSPGFTEWLALDFGETMTIQGISLTPRFLGGSALCFPADYQVQSTTDGSSWATIPGESYTNQPIPTGVVTHQFSDKIDARGIRILATKLRQDDYGNYYFQLAEIQPVLASASKEIDIGSLVHLSGVKISPLFGEENYAYPIDYSFEYSYDQDGAYWFPLSGSIYEDQPEPTEPVTHTFSAQVLAQRLRITVTEIGPDGAQLSDIDSIDIDPIIGSARFPFETSNGAHYDAQLNMLWTVYGNFQDAATNDDRATLVFGSEPAWYEWLALKYSWSTSTVGFLDHLRNALIVNWPQSADGYIWSWSTQEKWPTGDGSYHQENNAKYILGAWRIWLWTRDDTFFEQIDSTTHAPAPRADVSEGRTVKEKLREAMRYMEESLKGNLGGILIEDNGMGNTGRPDGDPTNYWDNWPFGYYDGYTNIYYYASLNAMAEMESLWGEEARATVLRSRAESCKQDYVDKFWDTSKGRFIACIDKDGIHRDFGGTFHNLEALAYGLGDAGKASLIFSWLDGERTIAGDTSTGQDIYTWGFAPRSNTIKIESVGPPYWWFDLNGAIQVTTNARWDVHLENGGAIFYTSYYDLMARLRWAGAEKALQRLGGILNEFETDQLRRDPNIWQLGIIGEFPESGLVPCALVHGFAGINPDKHGLRVVPHLPASWNFLTVRDVSWAGRSLTITSRHNQVTIHNDAGSGGDVFIGKEKIHPGSESTAALEAGQILLTLEPVTYAMISSRRWSLYR